ncbi:MAG: RNA polymerase sigma factor [Planctomycetota bacterium]
MALNEKREPQGTLEGGARLLRPLAGKARPPSQEDRPLDDQELQEDPNKGALLRAQQGEEEAFRELVENNQRRVYGLVIRMLSCDRETAADLSQEVFMRVYRGLARFDGRALFTTWLHKITMNVIISEVRHRRAMKRDRRTYSINAPIQGYDDLHIDPDSTERDPSDRAHHKEISVAVQAAVAELPDEFRECVLLRDMQGLSYEEISDVLELAPGTVRSKIHRGRLILQKKLKEFMP